MAAPLSMGQRLLGVLDVQSDRPAAFGAEDARTLQTLGDTLADAFPWCAEWHDELKALFGRYVDMKLAQQVLDYDDLLLYWHALVQDDALARDVSSRFDHVLVDEYQDTNRLQAAILLALKPDGRGLTVVGDDAQAIYSFRAAEVRNILDFPQQFTPPARVLTLERNYRSTRTILAASNAVIAPGVVIAGAGSVGRSIARELLHLPQRIVPRRQAA